MTYKIGDIVTCRVTGIQAYGVFVFIDEGAQGLIHVSEIQSGFTKNIFGLLKIGQTIEAMVLDIDDYSQKMTLSLRALEKYPLLPSMHKRKYFTNFYKSIGFSSIEKSMPTWKREAMEFLTKKR